MWHEMTASKTFPIKEGDIIKGFPFKPGDLVKISDSWIQFLRVPRSVFVIEDIRSMGGKTQYNKSFFFATYTAEDGEKEFVSFNDISLYEPCNFALFD